MLLLGGMLAGAVDAISDDPLSTTTVEMSWDDGTFLMWDDGYYMAWDDFDLDAGVVYAAWDDGFVLGWDDGDLMVWD